MQVIVDDKKYKLESPCGSGGEGEIYELPGSLGTSLAVKIYHPNVISDERKQKVSSLCQAYYDNVDKFGNYLMAFPKSPAYERAFLVHRDIIGFAMPYFIGCPHVNELNYDTSASSFREASGKSFNDGTCIEFIYKLFKIVDELHSARIVLGDVNTGNILCQWTPNGPEPALVDLDAVQFGNFSCTEFFKPEFLDPDLESLGKSASNRYIYSSTSDIFALAAICYHLWVGFYPYTVRTKPAIPQNDAKLKNLSVLGYITDGSSIFSSQNKEYLDASNKAHQERLMELKSKDSYLYSFFVSVLVKGERKNLLEFLPKKDQRRTSDPYQDEVVEKTGLSRIISNLKSKNRTKGIPAAAITSSTPVPTVVQRIDIPCPDPNEFLKFLSGYGIDIKKGINYAK